MAFLTERERDDLLAQQRELLLESATHITHLQHLLLRQALVAAQLAEAAFPEKFARELVAEAEQQAASVSPVPPLNALEIRLSEQR